MAWFRAELQRDEYTYRVLRDTAATKLVFTGRIVTMDDAATVIDDGMLFVEGDRITYVGPRQSLPSTMAQAVTIDTRGTIYPGLFELHNHPSYNAIPLWEVPERYRNRKCWRNDQRYKRKVAIPNSILTHDPTSETARAVVRFVECRALLGGVTTTQGITIKKMDDGTKNAYRGLVRNLELPDDEKWPAAEDRINDFDSFADAEISYGPFLNDASHPYILHLSEGTDADAREVFQYLQRPDGTWLIGKNLIAIHATGLNANQLEILAAGGGIVWSPLSNLLLYGKTTKVKEAHAAGIPIAIGSDWGPSGTKNLLGELKIAKIVSKRNGNLFSDLQLARMVTSIPAAMVGWDPFLGSLESGKIADLLILDGREGDPYRTLIDATEAQVAAVVIGGRPRAGKTSHLDPRTPGVELTTVSGHDVVLDIVESPGHPLAHVKLSVATATLAYALENLPDMAAKFFGQHQLMSGAPNRFSVHLDLDEDYAMALIRGDIRINRDDVDPMQLDPITAVDDKTFRARLIANMNIPDWIRDAL